MRRFRSGFFCLLFCACILMAGCGETQDNKADDFAVMFANAGRCDAIIVRVQGKFYMIDTGLKESAPKVLRALDCMQVDKLTAVFLTHTHKDHIGGLSAVAQRYEIDCVYAAEISQNKKDGSNAVTELVSELGLHLRRLKAGEAVRAGDSLRFEVIGPLEYNADDDNDNSLVLSLRVNNRRLLFAGDMQFAEEKSLMRGNVSLSADILKVGNHGNPDATSDLFAMTVSPELAFITTDTQEDKNSANKRVIAALETVGAEVILSERFSVGALLTIAQNGAMNISNPLKSSAEERLMLSEPNRETQSITVYNTGESTVQLQNFFIFSERNSEIFIFPSYLLKKGESVTISCEAAGDLIWPLEKIFSKKKANPTALYNAAGELLCRVEGK